MATWKLIPTGAQIRIWLEFYCLILQGFWGAYNNRTDVLCGNIYMSFKLLSIKILLVIYGPLLRMSRNKALVQMGGFAFSVFFLWLLIFFGVIFSLQAVGLEIFGENPVPIFSAITLYGLIQLLHIHMLSDSGREKIDRLLFDIFDAKSFVSFTTSVGYCLFWWMVLISIFLFGFFMII